MDVSDPFGVTLFQNQIRIESTTPGEPFGGGGDSGSLVIHRTRSKAVGLYFANTVDGSFSLANNIIDVLSELEIELL